MSIRVRANIVTGNWHDVTLPMRYVIVIVDYSSRFETRGACHFQLLFERLLHHRPKRGRHVLTVLTRIHRVRWSQFRPRSKTAIDVTIAI